MVSEDAKQQENDSKTPRCVVPRNGKLHGAGWSEQSDIKHQSTEGSSTLMTQNPTTFTITDPRTFDGDAFEVAGRAVAQLGALALIAEKSIEATKIMVRNAELERQCQRGEDVDAPGWPNTPEGRKWADVEASLAKLNTDLKVLQRAAAFNPRKPPRAV